jgi:hypothetical protein
LALVISVGTVCRKLSFGDPVHSLAFTVSIMTNKQSASGDKWDWNNLTNGDDDIAVPFYGGWWPSPFKPIFTALATKEKVKREDMKSNFERLQSDGMLLPCRLDEGDSCFREITPSVTDYFAKLLRSSSATDASEPRLLLHNPLQEGTFVKQRSADCILVSSISEKLSRLWLELGKTDFGVENASGVVEAL